MPAQVLCHHPASCKGTACSPHRPSQGGPGRATWLGPRASRELLLTRLPVPETETQRRRPQARRPRERLVCHYTRRRCWKARHALQCCHCSQNQAARQRSRRVHHWLVQPLRPSKHMLGPVPSPPAGCHSEAGHPCRHHSATSSGYQHDKNVVCANVSNNFGRWVPPSAPGACDLFVSTTVSQPHLVLSQQKWAAVPYFTTDV